MIGQQAQAEPGSRASGGNGRWRTPGICLALAAITFAVFGQTAGFQFVNFDDNTYVYENATVLGGLSIKGLAWIFTHDYFNLYHPLTLLSLMVDHQFYGLHAGGYHFTNVLLHTASVILLFLILRQMTGALWRSAFVAAVYAIHPLRAESVAWVAERKDVLGSFFFMLTLGAYVRYVRKPDSLVRYLMVAAAFALALLSKLTVVTLPFVLLLLDYWPMHRFEQPRRLSRLILEKIPLLALAAGVGVVNFLAAGKLFASFTKFPMSSRIGNALVAYVVYLRQMVWPEGLAVFYPWPERGQPDGTKICCFLLLALLTGGVLVFGRMRRWLVTGWFWYLGMLLPMIGLVQVGEFAHADRMTYLPGIGICIAVTWLVAEWRLSRKVLGTLMAALLGVLMVCACKQAAYWQDSETLWARTLSCTTDNYLAQNDLGLVIFQKGKTNEAMARYREALRINPNFADACGNLAFALLQEGKTDDAIAQYLEVLQFLPGSAKAHFNLGNALLQKGKTDEAIRQFLEALQLEPSNGQAENNLGSALLQKGRVDEAILRFQTAVQINPDSAEAHYNLGQALSQMGRVEEAITQYQEALQISPIMAKAHYHLGDVLRQEGRTDEAIMQYREALQSAPSYGEAENNLGTALRQLGRVDEAISHYQRASELMPNNESVHFNLARSLLQKGRVEEAITQYQTALQIEPADVEAQNNLAWVLATCGKSSLRNGNKAVQLAHQANELAGGKNPVILGTLAAAYAETGQFVDARRSAQEAITLAQAAGQPELVRRLNSELQFYKSERPFHQP